jgi:competence protein ComEC
VFLPFTVAFIVGLLAGSVLPYAPASVLILLCLAAAGLTALERRGALGSSRGLLVYGAVLAGVMLWTVTGAPREASLLQSAGTAPVRLAGTIVAPVKHAPGRMTMVLEASEVAEGADARPASGRVRVTWRDPDQSVSRGASVELTARLHAPSGLLNPGGFDYGAYLERQGIDAVASVSGPGRISIRQAPAGAWLPGGAAWPGVVVDGWRDRIRRAASASLQEPALGLYLGMIIGDPGYVSMGLRDAFMATGTVHILSVSGSHLGLIAFLSFFVIRGAWRRGPAPWLLALSRRITPTRLAAAVTVLPVTFYTLLAGAEVATVRSLIMILCFLLAVWLGRGRDLLLTLAAAALVILAHDPRALFDISFQLSYLSVLAIALLVRLRQGTSPELPGVPADLPENGTAWTWLRDSLWLTAGITLATLPVVAYDFNQVAWMGLLANLLVVPFAGFLLVPAGLLSAVWVLLAHAETLPAAAVLQRLFDLLADAVTVLARVPGAEWHVASPTMLGILVFYLFLYAAWRAGRRPILRGSCAVLAACVLGWWLWSPRVLDGRTLRVTFLDVGQGDAALLELPDGRTILIDGGASYDTLDMGRSVIGPYLWDRGISRLDLVIGTHPQLDHVGGLAWLVRAFEVGRYWGNGIARDEPFAHRLQQALRDKGLTEEQVETGQVWESGPCRLEVLNPPRSSHRTVRAAAILSGTDLNNHSVVTRLDCGRHSFLFTADVETQALARLQPASGVQPVTVLKVPHHGARSSLDERWIRAVGAELAVISVGNRNSYGHPAPDVVLAYGRTGTKLFRTDRDGAVWVIASLSSARVAVFTARGILPRRLPLAGWTPGGELMNLTRLWTFLSRAS